MVAYQLQRPLRILQELIHFIRMGLSKLPTWGYWVPTKRHHNKCANYKNPNPLVTYPSTALREWIPNVTQSWPPRTPPKYDLSWLDSFLNRFLFGELFQEQKWQSEIEVSNFDVFTFPHFTMVHRRPKFDKLTRQFWHLSFFVKFSANHTAVRILPDLFLNYPCFCVLTMWKVCVILHCPCIQWMFV